jgi:Ca2+-transporting ATPase
MFIDENTPFGVTRGHLAKLIPRKDLVAFYQLKGLAGIAKALRTDLKRGLPANEETITGTMSFEEVQQVNPEEPETKAAEPSFADADEDVKESKTSAFADRKRVFGDNRLPQRKAKNFFQLAWEALQDKILILLCVAAVISLALGIYQSTRPHTAEEGANIEWVEGVAILVAVFIVVFVGALNDWQKERQFKKLNAKKEDRFVKVIRSGTTQKVSVWDVFPGDVMILDQGDVVPVDGIFIEGHNLSCDESSATGESDLLKKTPGSMVWKALHDGQDIKKMDPFIIGGARVSEGVGTFLVTAVGVNSSHGKLMMALTEDNEATPLQFKLNRLASYIAKLGSSAGLLLFIVLFIEYLTRLSKPADTGLAKTPDQKAQGFINILIVAVTIIVVAVPEGLPLAVTLALAFATKRMTKDNNLVRHLQSCETMGNATVICSDKTGTLTQNVMTVVAVTFGRGNVRCGDKDRLPTGDGDKVDGTSDQESPVVANGNSAATVEIPIYELHDRMDSENQLLLKESIAMNSTAFEGDENGKKVFIGSKTETALLDFAVRCFGLGVLQKEREALDIVQLIPFDSGKKCMGVVIKQQNN